MKPLSNIGRVAIAIGACLLVFFITREVYRDGASPPAENSTVLLEQVRKVMKLVTVEGDFNELYSREDSWNYNDWLARFPGFKKKIMLRVKARVSVGYDLSGSRLVTDEETHTIYLDLPARPEVLSLEHDVDYYDLDEGVFNHFAPEELTTINAEAKKRIREKVDASGLFKKAEEQRAEVIGLVRALVESKGWKFEEGTGAKDGRTRLKG
jgi:Protein of unknown function (DUF4230)